MGDVLELLYNFINDKPAPDAKHLSRMAIARIKHLQQQIKELKKAQELAKRELFSMAAMQGLCARSDYYHTPQDLVSDAVKCADALLAELDKDGGE